MALRSDLNKTQIGKLITLKRILLLCPLNQCHHSSKGISRKQTQGWMDKHLVYTHNAIAFSVNKEENSDFDIPRGHNAKWNKSVTKGQTVQTPLIWGNYTQRRKVERWFPGAGKWGDGQLLIKRYRVTVWEDEKLWRWLYNVNALDATELYS